MKAAESLVASLSILLFGFITLPLAVSVVGVTMTARQGAIVGVILFFARWALLYVIRCAAEWLKARHPPAG